ncbi:glycosyltransferase family 4 protein [Psychroserpens damuponensis]|uniref:glycosyltransferase family 4 protein n=1 Tax=Psychroserpens damuponensis TaxID=943936 RepID=UPI00058C6A5F|nr:glycosyltransferase family 4 protein [Psychroserpens damuponensis]
MTLKPEFIYIAFDVFPSQKGAATHIEHCLKALQATFKSGLLICLGNEEMPTFQFDEERQLYVYRWKEKVVNFLERTQKFQDAVTKILNLPLCENIQLIHFRDIWGGIPVLQHTTTYKTVFEVNAFQHIELPNRYPTISTSVLEKIKQLEQFCVSQSDVLITPSIVTQKFIITQYKVNANKVTVIPNGVTIYDEDSKIITLNRDKNYILYFGALQKWQGIKTLFKAIKELKDLNIQLVICTSIPEKRTEIHKQLAQNIGVFDSINWHYELNKKELAVMIKNAILTVAPLSACDRNIVQGCNPLKILESMSYGIPVVASDIPVVRELIEDNVTGFLVPPDRPEDLGRAIRALLEQPEKLKAIGTHAKQHIKNNYLWIDQESKMKTVYKNRLTYV